MLFYMNSFDAYTLYNVYEQDSVVVTHMRRQTTHLLLLVCYKAHNEICAYIAHVLLSSIPPNF